MRVKVGNQQSEDRFALEFGGGGTVVEGAAGRAVVSIASAREQLLQQALGYFAESHDRRGHGQALAWTAQQVCGSAVYLYAGEVVTNILAAVSAAPGTPGNLNKVNLGVYSALTGGGGNQLAITADASTAFQTTGMKVTALASPYTVPASGVYYLTFWADQSGASGMPSMCGAGASALVGNAIGSLPILAGLQTGQAAIPASLTLTVSNFRLWLACN